MKPDRWTEVTKLFGEAVELDGDAREALLARVETRDERLASEVRSLLIAHGERGPVDELEEFMTGPEAVALLREEQDDQGGPDVGAIASDWIANRLNATLGDRYSVEGELGHGGMAIVFRAQDLKHGRPVAIKVLRPELAAALGSERFLREIEIAAQLNHPNVLGLHDSGEADGLLYFVMPFVEGESLRDRLQRDGTMPLDEACRIMREIGSALGYAHERGLVHRDVKPENILFQAGHALVCDFGIAKAASEAQHGLTKTGLAIGTLRYMSPEQLSDEAAVDGRADLYASGCILYEMLTGEPPFSGSSPQAAYARRLSGELRDVREVRPDLPETVGSVIRKALEPEPDDRYQTADELSDALEYAQTRTAQVAEAKRRRRARWLRVAAAAGLLAALGIGAWTLSSARDTPSIERIALLPEPASDDQAVFVQGVNQDLALELAKAGVRVKSPTSVARFVGSGASVGIIADSLDVQGIVNLDASLVDGRAEISLALVDGETEDFVWAEAFSGEERDILSLYGDMTRALARQMGVRLSDEVLARLETAPPVDPAVFEALRTARYHWQTLTQEGIETAQDYYQLALSLDSTSAEAWVGVGQTWQLQAQQGLISAEEANRLSAPALARAAELDPLLPAVQSSIGLRAVWVEFDWEQGETAFLNALERDPLDAVTRSYYALLLLYLNRDDEADRQMAQAADMDPFNTLIRELQSQMLNALGRQEEAESVLLDALSRDRGVPFLLSTLRTTYHLMGRHDEALEMWRASFTDEGSYSAEGDPEALAALERGYAEGGYRGALRAIAELYVERSATEHITPWRIATLYARAGIAEEALHYFEEAYEAGDQNLPYLATGPEFDLLRDEPRFQALIDALGLPR